MALLDMADNTLRPGQVVWCEGVFGFPGDTMKAEVLDRPTGEGFIETAHYGRVAVADCVWVRQLPTAALPLRGIDPWITRWPARKVLGV